MTQITAEQLRGLLEEQRPKTVLHLLESPDSPAEFLPFRIEAMLDLLKGKQAEELLDAELESLTGDMRVYGEVLKAYMLYGDQKIDQGLLRAKHYAQQAESPIFAAMAWACVARGYAYKSCPELAQEHLQKALDIAPNTFESMNARARIALHLDQRVEAREFFEQMQEQFPTYAAYQCASVSYLLGEFEQAEQLLQTAFDGSEEFVLPWLLRATNALRAQDPDALELCVNTIEQYTDSTELIEEMRKDVEQLRKQHDTETSRRVQLPEFPSTVQRRDYCGPTTIELVLRFWRGGLDRTNDQIAASVKFSNSGTPIYRLREFFHLVGFETIRASLSIEQIKRLIDAGFPVIIEQEFPNSFHVTVVIGYDEDEGTMLLQDPSSHIITQIENEKFDQLRISSRKGAIVAFPEKQGHDRTLALMDIYDDQALRYYDQASILQSDNQLDAAAKVIRQALDIDPHYQLAWLILISIEFQRWDREYHAGDWPANSIAAKLLAGHSNRRGITEQYRQILMQAQSLLPDVAHIRARIGHFALLIGELDWAVEELQHAAKQSEQSAFVQSLLANTYFERCEFEPALEAAEKAVRFDPGSSQADLNMARILAATFKPDAEHYALCAVERSPRWWAAQLALGEAHLANRDIPKAQAALSLAYSLFPTGWSTRLAFSDILIYTQEAPSASPILLDAQKHLQELTPYQRYLACYNLACLHSYIGEFSQATKLAQQALSYNPTFIPLRRAYTDWSRQLLRQRLQQDKPISKRLIDDISQGFVAQLQLPDSPVGDLFEFLMMVGHIRNPKRALKEMESILAQLPERPLHWVRSMLLYQFDKNDEAFEAALAALNSEESLIEDNRLYRLLEMVMRIGDPQQVIDTVMSTPYHFASQNDRIYRLGIALSDAEILPDQAREFLQQARQEQPDNPMILQRLAGLSEEAEERETLLREALILSPSWLYARLQLSKYLYEQQRYDEVLELTTGHTSSDYELLRLHARTLIYTGRPDLAVVEYQRLFENAEVNHADYYYKAIAESSFGLYAQAIETLKQALEHYAEWTFLQFLLADNQSKNGDYEQARQTIDNAREQGLEQELLLAAEYSLAWQQQDYQQALNICMQALEYYQNQEKPEDTELSDEEFEEQRKSDIQEWIDKRMRQHLELGQIDQARELAQQGERTATEFGTFGWTAIHADETAFALEMAEAALALDPENYKGLFVRAGALLDLEGEEAAIPAYHELRKAHPDEHNAYEKLAQLLTYDNKLDEAYVLAERSLMLGAFCHIAWATRAYVNFARGEDDKAISDFEQAWNRSDITSRLEGMNTYWWIWHHLRGNQGEAERTRQLAIDEAKTETEKRHIAHAESVLASRSA